MDMIPSWARVGAKVVATRNLVDHAHESGRITSISKGQVFTIREVGYADSIGKAYLLFAELVHSPVNTVLGVRERAYPLDSFRPLITKEQDIEMFKAIADDVSGRVDRLAEELDRV